MNNRQYIGFLTIMFLCIVSMVFNTMRTNNKGQSIILFDNQMKIVDTVCVKYASYNIMPDTCALRILTCNDKEIYWCGKAVTIK